MSAVKQPSSLESLLPVTYYDPDRAPESGAWLALSLAEKNRVVTNFHSSQHIRGPKGHEVVHVVVEDELARGHGPSIRALERLMLAGASRHEAVHLIGKTICDHRAWTGDDAQQDQGQRQRAMNAAIDLLAHAANPSQQQ